MTRMLAVAICLLVALSFGLAACRPEPKYEDISETEAQQLIASGDVVVIDVREPFEYDAGHIPGAKLIPLGTLKQELSKLDKTAQYIVVCRSGNRSGEASRIMAENGFRKVKNMQGGMLAWQGPVER